MRFHSLFLRAASLSGVALVIGCSSGSGNVAATGSGSGTERGAGNSGGSGDENAAAEGEDRATAFIEVDNGFESDDPTGGSLADRTRRAWLSNRSFVANSASNSNVANTSGGNNALDAAAARVVQEADVIKVDGDRLYALSRYGGLAIVDITNPDRMKLLGRKRIDGVPFEMYVRDGRAFVMLNEFGRWMPNAGSAYGQWVQTSELLSFDVSNPTKIIELSHFDVPGTIADSRVVGDAAYVVTYEDGRCFRCQDKPATIVTSFAIRGAIEKRDQLVYASPDRNYWSWKRSVSATDQRLYIGGPEWGRGGASSPSSNAGSVIQVVDITDPSGKLRKGADIAVAGRIESRWQMDEHDGVLRVVSQFGNGWGGTNGQINPKVQTFAVTSSTHITPLGSTELILPKPEQLRSVRFDGERGYAITVERTDPLFTIDLSDPASPRQAGDLEMPGWIFHMEPRGDRLIGFGYDGTTQSAKLAVSLFDVSDLSKPTMLRRVSFGTGWAEVAEDQDRIHKSVRVLDDAGMILVPFASHGQWIHDRCEQPQSGIQLIDYGHDDLTLRGLAPQWGMPRRAFVAKGRLLAMSDRNVTTFDIASRDAPVKRHELDLSSPAYRLAELPDHVASITNDWWSEEVMLSITPKANADDAEVTGKLSLASLAPASQTHCSGGTGWASWYAARLFGDADGNKVYVTVPVFTIDAGVRSGKLIAAAIDVSNPLKPFIAGKTEVLFTEHFMPRDGYWALNGGFADGRDLWSYYGALNGAVVGAGEAVVQHGAKLAYIETRYEPSRSGSKKGEPASPPEVRRRLHVVDFASPTAPKTHAIDLPGSLGTAPLHVYKGTVLTSRWQPSTRNPGKVRFFVDRVDLNGPTPSLLPSINTPGSLVLADEASSRFVTADYRTLLVSLAEPASQARTHLRPGSDNCYTKLGSDAWYDSEQEQCIRVMRDLTLTDVENTKVALRQVMTLPAQNIAGVQVADDRIYVTRYKTYEQSQYREPGSDQPPKVLEDGGLWAIGGVRAGELAIVSEMIGDAEWPLAAHGTKVALSTPGGLAIYDTAKPAPVLLGQATVRGDGSIAHVLMNDTRAIASLREWGLQTIAY